MDSSIHILLTCIYDYSGHLLLVSRFFAALRITVPAGVWLGGLFFSDLSSALSVSSFLGKEPALRSMLWGH